MKIFVTGGTGFIGQRLVMKLAASGNDIFLLVRKNSLSKAKNLFKDFPSITYIEGDVQDTDVLNDIYSVSHHIDQIDCVIHLAALYQLNCSLQDAYLMNVIGTQNVLNLISKMKNVKHFHYFSTYAVNSVSYGIVDENMLANEGKKFSDEYARTKNEAEHIVRKQVSPSINTVIHRPGIIIGDSKSGKMDKIDGPYYFFELIKRLKQFGPGLQTIPFLPLPILKDSLLPILPVDILVDWSSKIIQNPPTRPLTTYHLLPSERISTQAFVEASLKHFGLSIKILPIGMGAMFSPLFSALNLPKEMIFYMQQGTQFKRDSLIKDYADLAATSYEDYLPNIISGYLKESR